MSSFWRQLSPSNQLQTGTQDSLVQDRDQVKTQHVKAKTETDTFRGPKTRVQDLVIGGQRKQKLCGKKQLTQ